MIVYLLKRTLGRRLTEQTLDDSEQNTDDGRFTEQSIRRQILDLMKRARDDSTLTEHNTR